MSDSKVSTPATASITNSAEYVLVGYESVTFRGQDYPRGKRIDAALFKQLPPNVQRKFWKVGSELPSQVFNNLPEELQKHFKVKS